ncbi:MAG: DNA-processing protein DprA [Verrucomicrobiota bacterium]|jgi:DNA processing protein|nr:DNA-processing protein DprA [Verrucomicrobiota bacterium]
MNRVPGLGAVTVKRMAERFGSLGGIPEASEGDLAGVPGLGPERAQRFCAEFRRLRADDELARAEKKGVKLVTWVDEGYPALLRQIADPPLVLYVAGAVEALDRPAVAVIGTRRATVYGRECARRFGYQLASAGYTVVSGLALGIDTEAHTGAVQAKGRTVAVLGGALDCLFPKENAGLARSIIDAGGAVVCDYPFGRQPDAQTFPMRNRIVSGLSKGVLVVESPLKSGTLITVGQALDQGRSVMAVPGRIDSPASQGSHKLIREGARLVTTVDDVIEEVQDLMAGMRRTPGCADGAPAETERPETVLTPDERAVMACVGNEAVPVDEVVRGSGLAAGQVSALLVGLQIKRLVRLLPGGQISRRSA